jgi:hypothetical protein
MRIISFATIAILAAASTAYAGTDSSEAPNPFTEPTTGQTTTSAATYGTGAIQPPAEPAIPGAEATGQPGALPGNAEPSTGFYQQQKKDTDSH